MNCICLLIICQESHAKTLSSLTKTDENLTASLMSITDLESSLSAAGDKYVFMQKLRDFISVICDFMQVRFHINKVPLVVYVLLMLQGCLFYF